MLKKEIGKVVTKGLTRIISEPPAYQLIFIQTNK